MFFIFAQNHRDCEFTKNLQIPYWGENSNGNIFVGRGKFSWQKSDEAFGNFFPDEIFYSYVLYTIYKYNMCHIKLKTEAGIKSFLIGKFFGISGMPDR